MPDAFVNGARLYYQQTGDGPDVVLIHAVTSNQAVWVFTGLTDAVASAGFRATTYDLRGHGASDTPPTGYTSADMAADLRGLLESLKIASAFIVGHSFGGVVGLHAAILHPASIAGVILSDSFFPGLREVEPNYGRPNVWVELRETFRKIRVELGETVDFSELFHAAAKLNPDESRKLEALVGPVGRGWLRQLPRLAETSCGDEVLAEAGLTVDQLRSYSRPLVALYDEFSPFLATQRWLAENVPDCESEIIPAAKHLAVVENTAGFTDAVIRHLKRMAGAPAKARCTSSHSS
jgi:pimeloyl-ACP methyl ester carboxylesterase